MHVWRKSTFSHKMTVCCACLRWITGLCSREMVSTELDDICLNKEPPSVSLATQCYITQTRVTSPELLYCLNSELLLSGGTRGLKGFLFNLIGSEFPWLFKYLVIETHFHRMWNIHDGLSIVCMCGWVSKYWDCVVWKWFHCQQPVGSGQRFFSSPRQACFISGLSFGATELTVLFALRCRFFFPQLCLSLVSRSKFV